MVEKGGSEPRGGEDEAEAISHSNLAGSGESQLRMSSEASRSCEADYDCTSGLDTGVDLDLVSDILEEMIDYGSERTGYNAQLLKNAVFHLLCPHQSTRTKSSSSNINCQQIPIEVAKSEVLTRNTQQRAADMSDQGSQTEETSLRSSEEIATQTDNEEREGTHSSKSAANKGTPTNEISQKIDDLECTIQILHEQLEKLSNENMSSSVCPDCKCNRPVLDCKQDSCKSKMEQQEANIRQAENITEISRQQKKGDPSNNSGHGDVGLCLSGGGRDGPVKVVSISPDGPIGRSGAEIPIGSRIVAVDARSVLLSCLCVLILLFRKVELEYEASQILEWLRGPNGSSVQIDLMKPEAGKDDEVHVGEEGAKF